MRSCASSVAWDSFASSPPRHFLSWSARSVRWGDLLVRLLTDNTDATGRKLTICAVPGRNGARRICRCDGLPPILMRPPTGRANARCPSYPPLEGEGRIAACEARCEPGWGDFSTAALFVVRDCHPTPSHISLRSCAPTLPLQGRVSKRPVGPTRFYPTGKSTAHPQNQSLALSIKIFCFSEMANQSISPAIPPHKRGASRSSRTLGAGCGGRRLRL
jgi:hypothetical protein